MMTISMLYTPRWVAAAALMAALPLGTPSARAEHSFDTTFAESYYADTFSTMGGASARQGSRMVKLPNGDIVVAGRVRLANDTGLGGYFNIGLVKYGTDGRIKPWSDMTHPHLWSFGDYVVYPNLANGGSGDARITSVDDIAYAYGRYYVLATRTFTPSPLDRDIALYAFNSDGSFRQSIVVIGSAIDEVGKAIDLVETNLIAKPVTITVLAERAPRRAVVAKVNESNAGLLGLDPNFNGGVPLQLSVTTSCSTTPQCDLIPADVVRPQRLVTGDSAPIYITASVRRSSENWDFMATRLNANGTTDSSYGFNGLRYIPFDGAGSSLGDFATAAWVDSQFSFGDNSDTLWITGNVSQSCRSGIGIAKLDNSGNDAAGFGVNGRAVYGGSTETGSVCAQDSAHFANAIVIQEGEVAVGGSVDSIAADSSVLTDGLLLRAETGSGLQRGLASLPFVVQSTRLGFSRIRSIIAAGVGRYSVSGDGDEPSFGIDSVYLAARLRPADTIFSDGFEP